MPDINDQSNDISIHDEETHKAVTTTEIPEDSKVSLDVNVTNKTLAIQSGSKIRYEELDYNQTIGTSFVTVYSITEAGQVCTVYLYFDDKAHIVNIIIDGVYVVNGLNTEELNAQYNLSIDAWNQLPRCVYTLDGGKGIVFEFPTPAIFETDFIIQVRRLSGTKQLKRGLVIRAVA